MIDIDCGAGSGDRGVKKPCSMVMKCRPNLQILRWNKSTGECS